MEEKSFFGLNIFHYRRYIIRIRCRVDRFDDNSRRRGAQDIERSTDDRLVAVKVDAGHGQKRRIDHAEQDRYDNDAQHDHQCRGVRETLRDDAHRQRTAEGTDNHDTLQSQVDDAGVFRETAAQSYQNEYGRI